MNVAGVTDFTDGSMPTLPTAPTGISVTRAIVTNPRLQLHDVLHPRPARLVCAL